MRYHRRQLCGAVRCLVKFRCQGRATGFQKSSLLRHQLPSSYFVLVHLLDYYLFHVVYPFSASVVIHCFDLSSDGCFTRTHHMLNSLLVLNTCLNQDHNLSYNPSILIYGPPIIHLFDLCTCHCLSPCPHFGLLSLYR